MVRVGWSVDTFELQDDFSIDPAGVSTSASAFNSLRGDEHFHVLARQLPVFEYKVDDRVLVVRADCSDEAIIVVAGEPQSPAHVICTRPEEGVADPGVVDQRSAKARLQVGVARHLADDLAEAIPAPWRARRR